jgi:hypothetical protein
MQQVKYFVLNNCVRAYRISGQTSYSFTPHLDVMSF